MPIILVHSTNWLKVVSIHSKKGLFFNSGRSKLNTFWREQLTIEKLWEKDLDLCVGELCINVKLNTIFFTDATHDSSTV